MQRPSANSKNIILVTSSVLLFCSLGIGLSGCAADSTAGTTTPTATGKSSTPKSADKKLTGTSTPLPTPSGTLTAKLDFTCENLEDQLTLREYQINSSYLPQAGSAEARALFSGGNLCSWQNKVTSEWLNVSVEQVSPQDYRDIAESLGGFGTPANFGTSNDSLEYLSSSEDFRSAKVLNSTYLITVTSNSINTDISLGTVAHQTEELLLGEKLNRNVLNKRKNWIQTN